MHSKIKCRQFKLNGSAVFRWSAVFMLFYSVGSLIIAAFDVAPISYSLYSIDNALYIFFISISIFFASIFFGRFVLVYDVQLNANKIIVAYITTLVITIPLCYLFPWGVFGQELSIGHSIKAMFRHVYVVASFLFLMLNHRRLLLLVFVDIFMLFLDPSRFFFVEAIAPKLIYIMSIHRGVGSLQVWLYLALAALLLLIIQSVRLGAVSYDFVFFAMYSDIVHASYPALQLTQFAKDQPFAHILGSDFFDIYSENIAPLGGFFFPGFFAISGNIFLDVAVAFFVAVFAIKIIVRLSKNSLIFPIISGVVILFQKFPPFTLFKLIFVLWAVIYIFRFLVLYRVKTSKLNNDRECLRKTSRENSSARKSIAYDTLLLRN